METYLYYIVLFSALCCISNVLMKSKKVNQFLNFIFNEGE